MLLVRAQVVCIGCVILALSSMCCSLQPRHKAARQLMSCDVILLPVHSVALVHRAQGCTVPTYAPIA